MVVWRFRDAPARAAARLRRVPPLAQDAVLVAVLATIQVSLLGPHRWVALAVALEPLPLLLRRTRPMVSMLLLATADIGLALAGVPLQALGASLVVAAYSAGVHQDRNRSLTTAGVGVAGLVGLAAVAAGQTGNADRLSAVLVLVVAWWVGASLRERRIFAEELARQAVELNQQADELRAARLELAERAVAAERLRLARELHDVVAHSLAIVALHSSVGAHNGREHPAHAIAALDSINVATRTALAELRTLLTVLREGEPSTAPLPSLADLSTLVSQAASAGVDVRTTVSGPPDALPPAVSLSAYRLIQEALTNVVKHAPHATATLSVAVGPGSVTLDIVNTATSTPDAGAAEGGAGLAGMRERVAAFDGEFSAGPTGTGGWRVHAVLRFESVAELTA